MLCWQTEGRTILRWAALACTISGSTEAPGRISTGTSRSFRRFRRASLSGANFYPEDMSKESSNRGSRRLRRISRKMPRVSSR